MPSNIFKSWGSPAYFGHTVYYIGVSNALKAFSMSNAVMGTEIVSNADIYGSYGSTPAVSANGSSNAIVWAINVNTHILHAYDALNVTREIGTGQPLGSAVKFSVPTVANGKVYVGTTNMLLVFGVNTPLITTQPQCALVATGSNATFKVAAATKAPPLRYQWLKDGAAIVDETNATLAVANAQTVHVGLYSVVVSDTLGSALSVNAILALDQAGITKNMDGTVELEFAGIPGQAYHLEATTNLAAPIAWQILAGSATNAPAGALWHIIDLQATNYPRRVYRSVSP